MHMTAAWKTMGESRLCRPACRFWLPLSERKEGGVSVALHRALVSSFCTQRIMGTLPRYCRW